jgi:hypothetical protein
MDSRYILIEDLAPNDEVEPRTPLSQRRRANAFVGSNEELV